VLYLYQKVVIMTDIIPGIGVAAFIVYTGFHLSYILSVKRSSEWMRDLFQNIEGNLNAAVAEFRETLENVKKITGYMNPVSEDVRQISGTVPRLEKSLRG